MPSLNFFARSSQMAAGLRPGTIALERFKRVARSTAGAGGLGALSRSMGVTSSATFILRRHLFGLTAALAGVAGIGNFLRVIGSLAKNLATVQGITKATTAEIKVLNTAIRQFALNTEFSSAQVSEAAVTIARSGKTASDQLILLATSTNLATAADMQLADTSKTLIRVLNLFGAEVEEVARTADVLVTAANSAVTEVEELMTALSFIGPLANQAGFSLEETAATLSVLANNGIAASRAGTVFRGILAALASPSNQAIKTLQALSGTIKSLNPEANNMLEIMTALKDINPGLGALSDVFRRRAMGGTAALISNLDPLEDFIARNFDAAGATKSLSDLIRATLIPQLQRLKSAFEEALLVLGDRGGTDAVLRFIESLRGAILIIVGVEEKIDNVTTGMIKFANGLRAIGTAILLWAGYRAAILATSLVMAAFNILTAANPIGLLAVAIAVAIVAMQLFGDKIVTIEGHVFSLNALAIASLQEIVSLIRFTAITSFNFAKNTVRLLGVLFVFLVDKIFNLTLSEAVTFWKESWKDIVDFTKDRINEIVGFFVGLGDSVKLIAGRMQEVLTALFLAFETIKDDPFDIEAADDALNLLGLHIDAAFIGMGRGISKSFTDAWARDWLPVMLAIVTDATAQMKTILIEEFDIDPDEVLERLNPANIAERIMASAAIIHQQQLKRARELREELEAARTPVVIPDDFVGPPFEPPKPLTQSAVKQLAIFELLRKEQEVLLFLVRSTTAEREKHTLQARAALIAAKSEGAVTAEMLTTFEAITALRQSEEANFAIEETIRLMAQQQEQILLTANAAESLRIITEIEEEATQAGGRLNDMHRTTLQLLIARGQVLRNIASLSVDMGEAISSAFEDWVFGAKTAKEALRELTQELVRLILRMTALQPLADFLSGAISGLGGSIFAGLFPGSNVGAFVGPPAPPVVPGSALGDVFDRAGKLSRFGVGGIISTPTSFQHAGGRGLMGESGPEAILPLKRGPGGVLGVEGGGQTIVNVNVTGVRDADSFRRSTSQIASAMSAAMSRVRR